MDSGFPVDSQNGIQSLAIRRATPTLMGTSLERTQDFADLVQWPLGLDR